MCILLKVPLSLGASRRLGADTQSSFVCRETLFFTMVVLTET